MASISLENVSKVYPGGTTAVDDVTLTVEDGEFMVFVGPSGCGKTTALRAIAGLEDITSGEIRIGGHAVSDLPPKSRDIAMVFQNYALYPSMTVFQNMAFGLRVRRLARSEIARKVTAVAGTLGLSDLLDRKPSALSGGQRQRVAMGRAMVREPQVFLMDEPLSNLDAKLRVEMRTEVARLQRELAVTTIYVTHDQSEAMTLGDRVCVLRGGRTQQVASPQEIYERPANLFVAGFIGSPQMNLLEGTVHNVGNAIVVRLGDISVQPTPATASTLAPYLGTKIAVGLRPEDVVAVPSASPRFQARVVLREDVGSDVFLHVEPSGKIVESDAVREARESAADARRDLLIIRVSRTTEAREGELVGFGFEPDRLHFFDLETGLSIR